MTLLFDGSNAFFAERDSVCAEKLILHLPKGTALLCNGIGFYADSGAVHIPKATLHEGENRLHLRVENRLYPCEGLLLSDGKVTPIAIPAEKILLSLFKQLQAQKQALDALTSRVERIEQKTAAKRLFQ